MKKKVILFIDGELQKIPSTGGKEVTVEFDDMEKCRTFIRDHATKSDKQHTYQPALLSNVIKPKVKTVVVF